MYTKAPQVAQQLLDPRRGSHSSASLGSMPPPSPVRKEQLLAWQQQRQMTSPVAKPEAQPRRRNSMQTVMSPERKPSTTATYTEQFLRRRRSQHEVAHDEQQLCSPRANGTRRRSSENAVSDAITRLNGLEPQTHFEAGANKPHNRLELEAGEKENGCHQPIVVVDPAVEKKPLRTTDPLEDVVASTGKGIVAMNDGRSATIDRDQSVAVSKLTMTKKRRAPCSRSTVALAVVAGIVMITVAGGVVVCRMYPSSPVADSIRFTADKMEESLNLLVVEVSELGLYVGDLIRTKWLKLLRSGRLKKAAHAAEMLVMNEVLRDFLGLKAVATLCFELMEDMPSHLRSTVSALFDVLKLSMEWIQSHLRTAFEWMELDNELLDRVRPTLLIALSSLVEVLSRWGQWTKSSLDQGFEWAGLKSNLSDVNIPDKQFLAPLVANQAVIQHIARELTAQESQALQDVKRFERRRATLTSAANSIIEDTRNIVLENVVDVKTAAMEVIEKRLEQLKEQYIQSVQQALQDFELASQQVEDEGGSEMLAEILAKSRVLVDAATNLERDLMLHRKTVDEIPADPTLLEDHTSSKDEPHDERATEDEPAMDAQRYGKERLPEEFTEVPVPTDRSLPEDALDSSLGYQIVNELVKEGLMTVEPMEAPGVQHIFPDEAIAGDRITEEQAEIVADLAEKDQVAVELPGPVVEIPKPSGYTSENDRVSENEKRIIARLSEEHLLDVKLGSSDKDEIAGEMNEMLATEVLMDVNGAVLEVEQAQLEVTKVLAPQNVSEADTLKQEVGIQQEDRAETRFRVPVDGTDVEFVVELDQIAGISTEQVEVERILPDVRTRLATQPGVEKEDNIEEQKMLKTELLQEEEHVQVHEEILHVDKTEIEVQTQQLNDETIFKVETDANEAEAIVAEVQHVEEAELVSVRGHDEVAVENKIQANEVGVAGEKHTEDVQLKATSGDKDTLETEHVVVAKEIQELEQLEQVLLQDESERVRVEEELRVIAKKEEIWMQSEQMFAQGEATQEDAVSDHPSTETIGAVADLKPDGWRSSLGIPASTLSSPALVQIGLLSVEFLGLAALAAYLFVRYHKRGLLVRSPRRRKRWQRLADMDESDAEEVVLLPDDSSDEEDITDLPAHKDSHLEVVELLSSVEVKAVSFDGEEAHEEEDANENYDIVEEKEELMEEDGEEDAVKSEFTRSQAVVIERVRTRSMDRSATSYSDTSVDDSDATSVSVITSPLVSIQETPDPSKRTRRRLREIRP